MELNDFFRLDGKTALVTGSSRGIGAALAEVLAAAGARVAVHSTVGSAKADAVAEKCSAYGQQAITVQGRLDEVDVPGKLVAECIERMGALDILVLNASVQFRQSWNEENRQERDMMQQVNFNASHEMMLAVLPGMREKGWGRIVTIGSVQQYVPNPAMTMYAATKSAQVALVKSLAVQVADEGITINNLAPGVIETDRNRDALSDDAYREHVRGLIPAAFFGQPADCAGPLLMLCSEAGRYITGADLPVDGGMGLGGRKA